MGKQPETPRDEMSQRGLRNLALLSETMTQCTLEQGVDGVDRTYLFRSIDEQFRAPRGQGDPIKCDACKHPIERAHYCPCFRCRKVFCHTCQVELKDLKPGDQRLDRKRQEELRKTFYTDLYKK